MVKISNLHELLTPAYEHGFAVLACNVRHPLVMAACLEAAFDAKTPIILQLSESEYHYCNWSFADFVGQAKSFTEILTKKYGYQIPLGIHLDHVQKDETLIDQALDAGFRSALLDLSALPDEENRKRCADASTRVHARNCDLEVEQGAIGFAKDLPHSLEAIEKLYATVEQALAMVEAVHPEALAIAVGNGHGTYVETPHIGFDRIHEIANALKPYKVPLVLHGGSGLKSMFKQAVSVGINKINYATELTNILFASMPENLLKAMEVAAAQQKVDLRKVVGQFKADISTMDQDHKIQLHKKLFDNLQEVFSMIGSADASRFYL